MFYLVNLHKWRSTEIMNQFFLNFLDTDITFYIIHTSHMHNDAKFTFDLQLRLFVTFVTVNRTIDHGIPSASLPSDTI